MSTTGQTLHGNTGLILQKATHSIDKTGLSTGSAIFTCPFEIAETAGPFPPTNPNQRGGVHPKVSYMFCEKRTVEWSMGRSVITCDFAGLGDDYPDDTPPVYELTIGVGQESIVLHPKFVTDIGGKPSAALNGAIFVDPQGNVTEDDTVGIFEKFALTSDFRGVSQFLDVTNITWRKSWTTRVRPTDDDKVGYIDTPEGGAPNIGGRDWLYVGLAYGERGNVFTPRKEWKASGLGGWNSTIYSA